MCKGPDEKGGPYRCPGDMAKGVEKAQKKHSRASQELTDAVDVAERADIQVEALKDEDSAQARMQERQEERAADCDGTYEDADSIAKEINSKGFLCAIEETSTYDPDNDYEGTRVYDDQFYEVKVFESEQELSEYTNGRYEASDGDTAYGLDDRTKDHSTGEMESQSLFIRRPEGEAQVDPDISKKHGREYSRAEADRARAARAVQGKRMGVVAAKHDLAHAQAEYDATPRGAGQLRREADSARRDGDTVTADHLESRLDQAETRVNADERDRRDNAERHGQVRGEYTFQPMSTGEISDSGSPWVSDEDRTTSLVQEDGISGCARTAFQIQSDRHGWSHHSHEVTLTRVDGEGKVREVTLPYRAGIGSDGRPPSVSSVMHSHATSAASYDSAEGDYDNWRAEMGYEGEHEDPDAYREGKKTFTNGQKTIQRLEKFIGSERFEQYKFDPASR